MHGRSELSRVLAPRGRAILDLGNSESFNASPPPLLSRASKDDRDTHPSNDRIVLQGPKGLAVIEHRAFQILPLLGRRSATAATAAASAMEEHHELALCVFRT